MKIAFIASALLSLFVIGSGIVKVYAEERLKSVFYGVIAFFASIAFIVSVVMIFIPDFFLK